MVKGILCNECKSPNQVSFYSQFNKYLCSTHYKQNIQKGKPHKLCKCGCGIMIPITNMNGDPRDYKKGHSSKGKNNPMWKGGKMLDVEEYVLVKKPDHPFANNNGYVREHRLVMENKLGRYLTKEEVVHHINGVKNQNNIENLMLYSSHKIHIGNHRLGKHIDTSDRRCFRCGSKTTYIQKPTGSQKTPKLVWCHLPWDKENWYCQKCYYKSNSKYKIQNIIA